MIKRELLKKMLIAGGDLKESGADRLIALIENDKFDANVDVITGVLVKATEDPDYLGYAINQLTKAKKILDENLDM